MNILIPDKSVFDLINFGINKKILRVISFLILVLTLSGRQAPLKFRTLGVNFEDIFKLLPNNS